MPFIDDKDAEIELTDPGGNWFTVVTPSELKKIRAENGRPWVETISVG